jgi:hypothetical protein
MFTGLAQKLRHWLGVRIDCGGDREETEEEDEEDEGVVEGEGAAETGR